MIRSGWHIVTLSCVVVALAAAILQTVGVTLSFSSYLLNFQIYLFSALAVLGLHLLFILWKIRPERPIGYSFDLLKTHKERALRALPLLLAVFIFMPAFSAMKSAIPLFNDYGWDQVFIDLDYAIHGGDAWRVMHPVLGYPVVTALLALAYQLWILLIYIGSVYFAFYVKDDRLVLRYFFAFILIWTIIGAIMATAFASVGPVFLEPIIGNARFEDQVRYLVEANETIPIMVLPVQEALLAGYELGNRELGRGITAMPSMHVALACLFWLAARRISKPLGYFFLAYLFVIQIGSVHLAYHYAVDGYVSIILTWIIWTISANCIGKEEGVTAETENGTCQKP